MYKPWLFDILKILVIIALYGIIGNLEKLPEGASKELELAQEGIPITEIATRF